MEKYKKCSQNSSDGTRNQIDFVNSIMTNFPACSRKGKQFFIVAKKQITDFFKNKN